MYISIENFIYFIILPFLFLLGMAIMYRRNDQERYEELSKEKDKYNELYEKYRKLLDEKIEQSVVMSKDKRG